MQARAQLKVSAQHSRMDRRALAKLDTFLLELRLRLRYSAFVCVPRKGNATFLNVKAFIRRLKPHLGKVPGYQLVHFFYRLIHGVESRNTALLLLWRPKGLYQPNGTTFDDRYPEISNFVREQIGDGVNVRILSIGCSTGEEVFSARRYFSQPTIAGLDINPFNIAVCNFRLLKSGDRRIKYSVARSTAAQAIASYDAIFAMSVAGWHSGVVKQAAHCRDVFTWTPSGRPSNPSSRSQRRIRTFNETGRQRRPSKKPYMDCRTTTVPCNPRILPKVKKRNRITRNYQ